MLLLGNLSNRKVVKTTRDLKGTKLERMGK